MGFLENLMKRVTSNQTAQSTQKVASGGGEHGLRQRLESVIAEEWSDYELRKEVSPAEFGAAEGARKLSYVLYRNGHPKAVMMVLTDRNHYRRSDVVKVQEACGRNGVPYMNFMSHLPNRKDYISERLRTNITG